MFQFQPGLFIWTAVSFGILVVLLYKVALPPLLSFLEQREKMIADSIARAEENRRESDRLLEEYRKKLSESSVAAGRMIEEARVEADQQRSEIIMRADQQAHVILEKAGLDVEREKNKIVADARKEIAGLALFAAEKVLRRAVSSEDNRRIIEESLKEAQA